MFEQISMFEMLQPENRFTHELKRGSGFEGGKVRIYCAAMNMNIKDFAVYLKDEYGVGGHSADFPDGGRGFTDYNSKGLTIREWKSRQEEKHSWQEVAREIKRLIVHNEYLTDKEWSRVQEVSKLNGWPLPMPKARIRIEAVIK